MAHRATYTCTYNDFARYTALISGKRPTLGVVTYVLQKCILMEFSLQHEKLVKFFRQNKKFQFCA